MGEGDNNWGSASSPILFENLLIVHADPDGQLTISLAGKGHAEASRIDGVSAAVPTDLIDGPLGRPHVGTRHEGEHLVLVPEEPLADLIARRATQIVEVLATHQRGWVIAHVGRQCSPRRTGGWAPIGQIAGLCLSDELRDAQPEVLARVLLRLLARLTGRQLVAASFYGLGKCGTDVSDGMRAV